VAVGPVIDDPLVTRR